MPDPAAVVQIFASNRPSIIAGDLQLSYRWLDGSEATAELSPPIIPLRDAQNQLNRVVFKLYAEPLLVLGTEFISRNQLITLQPGSVDLNLVPSSPFSLDNYSGAIDPSLAPVTFDAELNASSSHSYQFSLQIMTGGKTYNVDPEMIVGIEDP